MPTNDFLPFCPTDTGTNLLNESDYAAATDRTIGNQPGVASSKLVNKALRQSSYVVSQLAQYMANQLNENILDDATPAKLLAQFMATMKPYAPNITKFTSGSGTFNLTYIFQIASGNATVGATYTNNAITFTVAATVSSSLEVKMTGNGDPTLGGTLTKTGGTGDSTITFYAFRKPVSLNVLCVGGGGGGGGSGTAAGSAGSAGGNSSFGTTLITANGGSPGSRGGSPGSGGSASLGSGPLGLAFSGAGGGAAGSPSVGQVEGGNGGSSPLGGAGSPGAGASTTGASGGAAVSNTGSGGGGAGCGSVSITSGSGGGAGGFVNATIISPLSSYAYVVGAAGNAEAAGTNGAPGGVGSAGIILITENYQ